MSGGADAAGGLITPWTTLYTYDTLGNLTCVEQHGSAASGTGCSADPTNDATSPWRIRRFTYNSLGQLLTAKNPESGTITYAYDNDGNVTSKVSPAPNQTGSATLTITYGYDALHRLTGKTYSNGDPAVTYSYDQTTYNGLTITNGIGRRTGMADVSGQTAWTYDVDGKPLKERRTIAGITKELTYSYNKDGSPATLTYPSGAVVTFAYDNAAHLLSAVDSGNNLNYATSAVYTPTGALSSLTLGNSASFAGYTLANSYNNRLQPTLLSANKPTGTILSRFYSYGTSQQNNGNISAITDNLTADRSVSYTYDQLNRIATAQSTGTSCTAVSGNAAITQNWGNSYTIDAWGNLTAKNVTKCSSESLSTTVSVKNQLGVGTHDAAGNLMSNGGASYTYDAENRIASTAGVTYVYDGDGNRVKKSNGTLYWGETFTGGPIAESDLSGTITKEFVFFNGKRIARRDLLSGAVHYYISDYLGSASLVASASGVIEEDSDYYPYGGERAYIDTLADQNYKFTSKQRDVESGLDYFGARYYGNSLSRFLTPDWADKPTSVPYAQFGDPQSLNLYAYVRNCPVNRADVDGHIALVDDAVILAVVGTAMVATYLASPQGQRAVRETIQAGSDLLHKAVDNVSNTFSKSNSGAPPPPPATNTTPQATSAAAPPPPGSNNRGTNKRGQKTSRSSLRKGTVKDAWEKAPDGKNGGKTCPDCGKEVKVEPGSGQPRDWDVHHDPKWSQREFTPDATRQEVIDNYQEGTALRCPTCNRSDNQPPPQIEGPK